MGDPFPRVDHPMERSRAHRDGRYFARMVWIWLLFGGHQDPDDGRPYHSKPLRRDYWEGCISLQSLGPCRGQSEFGDTEDEREAA
jgi:hypothetical protein